MDTKCVGDFLKHIEKIVYCEDEKEGRLLLLFDYGIDEFVLQFERGK